MSDKQNLSLEAAMRMGEALPKGTPEGTTMSVDPFGTYPNPNQIQAFYDSLQEKPATYTELLQLYSQQTPGAAPMTVQNEGLQETLQTKHSQKFEMAFSVLDDARWRLNYHANSEYPPDSDSLLVVQQLQEVSEFLKVIQRDMSVGRGK